MAIPFEVLLAEMTPEDRERIADRTRQLVAEYESLQALRAARARSQQEMAERLGVNQAAVSKMERRADMYVSSLRDYIEALGGELEIVARFPDHPPVRIDQFKKI